MSVEDLITSQKKIGGEIQKIIANYKTDPADKKTLDYLKSRSNALKACWKEFSLTDAVIMKKSGDISDHPYLSTGYYEAIKKVYEQIIQDMNEKIEAIKKITQPLEEKLEPIDKSDKALEDINNEDNLATIESTLTENKNENVGASIFGILHKQRTVLAVLRKTVAGLAAIKEDYTEQFCQLKIKTIEQYLHDVQRLHYKIWDSIDDPTIISYDAEEYFSLVEEVQNTLAQLYNYVGSKSHDHKADVTANSVMKLPKIVLQRFDGDYLKWRQFHDLFTEVVHKQTMSECQKMWYLKSSLSGEAEKLVRHLTISDTNYSAAWKIITERYENPRLLVTALLNRLLSQTSITNESSSAIKALHDTTQECLLGLENLGINISHWDPLLHHLLIKRLDRTTHTLYEQSLAQPRALQSMKSFLVFLETRFQSLETLGNKGKSTEDYNRKIGISRAFTSTVTNGSVCTMCKGNHQLFACRRFQELTPLKRIAHVKGVNVCFNCLNAGHRVDSCTARACTKCSKRHNTLLHTDNAFSKSGSSYTQSKNLQSQVTAAHPASNKLSSTHFNQPHEQSISLTTKTAQSLKGYVLLSTAVVNLINNRGKKVECRAILDSGSQLNFMTEKMAKQLELTETPEQLHIEGIGQRRQQSHSRVNVLLQSRINNFTTRLEAHVLSKIISVQPTKSIDTSAWPLPQNIALADPTYDRPGPIDLLIGAEIYYSLLSIGQIKLGEMLPTLQNTVFGWTVAGKINNMSQSDAICGICSEDERLDQQIERFWKLEETEGSSTNFTTAEKRCEIHFNQNTRRSLSGRFIVSLPFLIQPTRLGESKDIALQRFKSLERKLANNEMVKTQYVEFMEEYLRLGHMREVNINTIKAPYYFLPHHCVMKPDSSTTKLRVVFDASAKTSKNISLNDILCTGPTIQDDVFSILLRFRLPRFVFTADIEKMYRQIEVEESDSKYQLIWWRPDPSESLKVYQLSTVTYGTTCAPYLATKCLQRLAEDQAQTYPVGSEVLKRDFYIDDVLTGADTLSAALDIQTQLQSILSTSGFKLRKWCANHQRLLQSIPPIDQELQLDFNNKLDEHIKTVGLIWLPKPDSFRVKTAQIESCKVTKRTTYSDITHLYDPLGIMAPVVVNAKLFLQRLWTLKVDWDAALPQELHTSWIKFRSGLKLLSNINFPRHVFSHRIPKVVQIHVFADASEKAYGAAAYIRSIDKDNIIVVRLLCAKSRIAPMKQTTLPRLELCAAKLAAELANRIQRDLRMRKDLVFLWSDSEIVLAWLNSSSSHFHTFVANRVSSIQDVSIPTQWRHVGSKDNPADILSRGIEPEKLEGSTLWFYGPTFLHGTEDLWPPPYLKTEECKLEKKGFTLSASTAEDSISIIDKMDHGNSFMKLRNTLAYIARFINIMRHRNQQQTSSTGKSLSIHEINEAQVAIIRHIQEQEFKDDLDHLKRFAEVNKNSSLSSLTPFIDTRGLIRVGGRLEASNLSYDAKHQILLPYTHPFTKLLLSELHKDNYHVGPQALLSIARQKFWPIKGKTLVRSIVKNCVRCAKAEPKLLSQLMGNLPADRIQPARPFVNSGVDFCGPVWTHYKIRGKRPQKSYIAVFCCFATKATHLELVTDLTTQGFLGALKRFMGRRGHCANIYCDNATNFVGAKNQLEEVKDMIGSETAIEKITRICSTKNIDFHFIPPRAPHFGGLWEAAVKSAKHLLQRTLADASLTYEELETAIVEIEAVLNSRPITPMSSDPNDLNALTPGHFLIGEPLVGMIDVDTKPLNVNLITRWKLVTHIKNEFWRRWSGEYLNQLQHRYKWKERCQNVQPGTMALIKEDNTPALKWPLGRIIKIHHGNDGLVRVADIRTSSGVLRRPIHKLAPLPIERDYDLDEATELLSNAKTQHSTKLKNLDHYKLTSTHKRQQQTISTSKHTDGSYQSPDTYSSPKKKARRSLGSAVATLLLTCLLLPLTHGSPVELSPFHSQPGIYFENLGVTNIISSEWNVIAYYDTQHYWSEFEILANSTQTLNYICHLMTDRDSCLRTVDHFRNLIEDISKTNELLQPKGNATTRVKRGALNFVGNIASALFGVLDSNYADKMSDTIEGIEQNEGHLTALIRNQTSLIDTTLNVMKKNQDIIDKHFQNLGAHITSLARKVNGLTKELKEERLSQAFISLTMQATLAAIRFQQIQASIVDVLVDTHHGKISPQLISPPQLRRKLTTIKEHIPSSLRLPVTQDEVLKFYNLMTIEARIATRHLIFRLRIPLLTLEDFELFKLVSVPVLVNNTFFTIQPSTPYLVINMHRDQYYPITEYELQSCPIIAEGQHLCKQKHPIYRRGSNISSCEVDLINHLPQSPSCQVSRVGDGPHWIQLNHPNEWIYALKSKTTLNVVCGNNITQTILEKTGILKIQGDCIIKQELITIQGHSIYPSISRLSYTPSGNLSDVIATQHLLSEDNETYHYHRHWAGLDAIKEQIKQLYNELPPKTHLQAHDVHQYTIAYAALLFVAALTIVIIWKFRATICQRIKSPPKPAARKSIRSCETEPKTIHPEFSVTFDA